MIKIDVFDRVNEKLAGGRVRIIRASHRHRAARIFQAVIGFIHDWRLGGFFLLHVNRQPAALNHEIADDAVKNRAVVKPFARVAQHVFHRFRRGVGV